MTSVQQVIVINGPAGVGKTTTSRKLAANSTNGICIDGDALRTFLVTRGPERPNGLTYVGAAALTGVYLDAGFERIVFDYVFERPEMLDRYRFALAGSPHVHVFTLWAPLHVVAGRERARAGRDRLGTRVGECWRSIEPHLDHLGRTIDADQSVDQVLDTIEGYLAA